MVRIRFVQKEELKRRKLWEKLLEGKEIGESGRNLLRELDLQAKWELFKKMRPGLEDNRVRNLTRLMFSKNISFLKRLLLEKQDRILVIEALGYLAAREAVEILAALLNQKEEALQLEAAGALKNHTPRLVIPVLIDLLLAGEGPPSRLGEVFWGMGVLAWEELARVYPQADPVVKSQILEILLLAQYPKIKELVADALRCEVKALRLIGLDALAAFAYEGLEAEVGSCLRDPEWAVRGKAIQVLKRLDLPRLTEQVVVLTGDEDPWVRECARKYLGS